MSNPAVSIIIPLFNMEKYIAPLLEGIQAQSFRDFEVICIDDESKDNTPRIIKAFAAHDNRFFLISKKNEGPGVARNVGIDQARGEWLLFFDGDDLVKPHLVERAHQRAIQTGADIVIFQSRHYDTQEQLDLPSPDRWDHLLFPPEFNSRTHPSNLFQQFKNWPWDKMFKRTLLIEHQIRFPALYRTEDMPFTCAALVAANRIALLDEELYLYRVNNPSSSTQTTDLHPFDFFTACKLLLDYLKTSGTFDRMRREYINWVTLCVLVNLSGLHSWETYHAVAKKLQSGGLCELELANVPDELFDKSEYRELIQTLSQPDTEKTLFTLRRMERSFAKAREVVTIEKIRDEFIKSTTFRTGRALLYIPTIIKEKISNAINSSS